VDRGGKNQKEIRTKKGLPNRKWSDLSGKVDSTTQRKEEDK